MGTQPMTAPLTSWHDTDTKRTILRFVASVIDESSPHYVSPAERIAVFDNDGTLWCEKPMYIQLGFLLRKLAAAAGEDASLQAQQPWKAAWERDLTWFGQAVTRHYQGDDQDLHVLLQGVLSLSEGQDVDRVEAEASAFVYAERHPTLGLTYRECAYLPMLDLLRYLEANGFTNWIVSGGGRDFMRGFSLEVYGIPRQRVLGSTLAYQYVAGEGGGTIRQRAELDVIDDGPGKPVQIWNAIGRRPILAAGNSDGDLPMLEFTRGPAGQALRLLLVHGDGAREFEYVAGAERALEACSSRGWTPISMRHDWRQVFARS